MLALLGLAPLVCAAPAAAQRGTAGPIYSENVDELFPELKAWLGRMEEQGWLLRGQATTIAQGHPGFRSRYRRDGDLNPHPDFGRTQTVDLVLGRRLWHNAELIGVLNLSHGSGLSQGRGVGAGLSAEAFHGGVEDVSVMLPRLFLRQTFDISYDAFGVDDDPMRFAGPLAIERVTLTIGRFAAWDFFDNNTYAHDPRTQFVAWALSGAGAFDIASDAAGFTNGAVLEWENGAWAVRAGAFQVAREQGGARLDSRIGSAWQALLQFDRRWWRGRFPGVARLLLGASRTRSGLWKSLTAAAREGDLSGQDGRTFRTKAMVAINLEQALNDSLGVFLRLGWNDGRSQDWMLTDMDWSVSAGVAINGWTWERFNDTVGIAANLGGLSTGQRRWLEAGGSGFVIGSGRIRYAPEALFETYYDAQLAPGLHAALGAQLVFNPGYDANRGPAPVLFARLRAAF